jgi:hypothetical protein
MKLNILMVKINFQFLFLFLNKKPPRKLDGFKNSGFGFILVVSKTSYFGNVFC